MHSSQYHPARIRLFGSKPDPGRLGERVMVVVPSLAHRDQAGTGKIGCLNAGPLHDPFAGTGIVGEIGNRPVSGHAHEDAAKHAPHHPGPSTQGEQEQADRKLLKDPGLLQESIEAIAGNFRFDAHLGRFVECEPAVELP